MKAGKLSESVCKRSVLKQLHKETTGFAAPAIGMDFGAAELGDEAVVTASASRPFGKTSCPAAGVYTALNNLFCSGCRPLGISVTLLLPTSANENDLRDWMSAITEVCGKEQIPVLNGHTEVVRYVTEPVLSVTAFGAVKKEKLITAAGAGPDMDVIVTKWIGLEGTVVLAKERQEELKSRYSRPFLDRAAKYIDYLSIRSEAAVAAKSGAAAMHDLSEGGIFGALWELGQCSGVGLEIDLKKIPIRQETVEICEFFDLNPYKLLSGGSLLLVAEDGNAVVQAIEKSGGKAVIIGRTTAGNDRVILNGEERRFLETTQTDELWKLEKTGGN